MTYKKKDKYIYIIKVMDVNIEAYTSEAQAQQRLSDLREFQALLMRAALHGAEEYEAINSFFDENSNMYIDKVLIKGD